MARQVVNSLTLLALLALLSVASCAFADKNGLAARMALAESKYQEAVDAGFAWRANRLALEAARVSMDTGNEQAAAAMIEEAIKLADASLAQAAREAEEWDTRFPFSR